ncbi:MAG: OpgC domain-containing protein [Alphaproteobacteria bacterium]|nr:OpgC domain-containing protein [Alphaproteobacteria bacterium]
MLRQFVRTDRDLRVDVFRGLALAFIFVDHIPYNILAALTLHNFGYSDATEMFIFLAGFSAGMAYGRRYLRQGWLVAGAHVLKRVWTLYVAHIFLFVLFTAQVAYSARVLDAATYIDEMEVAAFLQQADVAILHALTLYFQPAFMNILPLYIVVMLILVLVLPLVERPLVLMLLSGALYAYVTVANLHVPAFGGGRWFFNPLAWQVLFLFGVVLGHAGPEARARWLPDLRWLRLAAIAYVVFAFFAMLAWQVDDLAAMVPRRVAAFLFREEKSNLGPKRLLHFLSLAYLTARYVPRDAAWLRTAAASPLALAGQHALPVFCLGIFLSYAGRLVFGHFSASPATQMLVNAVGFGLQVGVAALSAWFDSTGRARQAGGGGALPGSPSPAAMAVAVAVEGEGRPGASPASGAAP